MPITINGSGTVTGISAGGLPDGVITTDDIAAGAVTQAKRSEQLTLVTAQASTSGTFIEFTGIPSWVKKISVVLADVSTNGSSVMQIQIGSGTYKTSGYSSSTMVIEGATTGSSNQSTGFIVDTTAGGAAFVRTGAVVLTTLGSNLWVCNFTLMVQGSGAARVHAGAGTSGFLSGPLDRIRITTVNGTDTFDAGSISILYE